LGVCRFEQLISLSLATRLQLVAHLLLKPSDLFIQFGIFADLIVVELAALASD